MDKRFLIYVGADKSGSTWFYNYMKFRPDCFVPDAKDLFFFDQNYHRGMEWYLSFYNASDRPINCDISHDYILSENAAKRLKVFSDQHPTTLVMFVRHPLDRAISQFRYEQRFFKIDFTFAQYLHKNLECRARSRYFENILKFINQGLNLKTFLFDDLKNSDDFLINLNGQLGLSSMEFKAAPNAYRKAKASRSLIVSRIGKEIAITLRELGLNNLLGKLKHSTIVDDIFYKSSVDSMGEKATILSPEERICLIEKYFLDDIVLMEDYLQRDLVNWKI